MKKSLFILTIALFVNLFSLSEAQAGIPIFWGTPEKVVKNHDLPKNPDYQAGRGMHFDLGYKYKVFELFWVPLFTMSGSVVGYVNDTTYIRLSAGEIEDIKTANNITGSLDSPAFWDAWGGKLLVLLIILFFIFKSRLSNSNPTDDSQSEQNVA